MKRQKKQQISDRTRIIADDAKQTVISKNTEFKTRESEEGKDDRKEEFEKIKG